MSSFWKNQIDRLRIMMPPLFNWSWKPKLRHMHKQLWKKNQSMACMLMSKCVGSKLSKGYCQSFNRKHWKGVTKKLGQRMAKLKGVHHSKEVWLEELFPDFKANLASYQTCLEGWMDSGCVNGIIWFVDSQKLNKPHMLLLLYMWSDCIIPCL